MLPIITFSGNLGGDAELSKLDNGTDVLKFTVAVNYDKTSTGWYSCTMFGARAKGIAPYLKKGSKVVVGGTFRVNEKGGKTYLNVNASEVDLVFTPKVVEEEPAPKTRREGKSKPADDDTPY